MNEKLNQSILEEGRLVEEAINAIKAAVTEAVQQQIKNLEVALLRTSDKADSEERNKVVDQMIKRTIRESLVGDTESQNTFIKSHHDMVKPEMTNLFNLTNKFKDAIIKQFGSMHLYVPNVSQSNKNELIKDIAQYARSVRDSVLLDSMEKLQGEKDNFDYLRIKQKSKKNIEKFEANSWNVDRRKTALDEAIKGVKNTYAKGGASFFVAACFGVAAMIAVSTGVGALLVASPFLAVAGLCVGVGALQLAFSSIIDEKTIRHHQEKIHESQGSFSPSASFPRVT